ncbi:MAG: conjugal transfer protein TraD [Rhodospirillales bacterium 20-64-7]|nr:MAG: conjugal transfer protein TraD [Rhodospirillales bacterium 20-64-7]
MSNTKSRHTHAKALRASERADGQAQFRFAARALLASALAGALAVGGITTSAEQAQEVSKYAIADLSSFLLATVPADPLLTINWHGQAVRTGVKEWAIFQSLRDEAIEFVERAGMGAVLGLALGTVGLWLTADRRRRKQEELLADRVIAGTRIVSETDLARMTAIENSGSALQLGSVAIPSGLETRHFAMAGTTGSGKTTALRQLLDAIAARGTAALVYDTSGEFIAHYYDPARGDVILNPFDQRGVFWNPFDEISHPADAARLARYLINETGDRDKDVWLEAARNLVANILRTLWQEGRCTLLALLDTLQSMPREELEPWLAHTSSARAFEKDAERATASVLFMLAKAVNMLMFLRTAPREGEARFSFASFFTKINQIEGRKPWIFVPRKEDYFEAVKPLMALWLECAASAVMGLSPSSTRRLSFILDELADLPRVDNLARLLPEGRKFGASVILTFQAIGQMSERYGREGAEALLGCCNTKLFLQLVDQASREWASETIGSVEVEIPTISETFDPKTGRPQRTLSATRQVRAAVLESEMRLPRHTAYLLLPDGFPVAKIKLTDAHIYAHGPARHPRFIPADISGTLWGSSQPSREKSDVVPETNAEAQIRPGPV